MISNLTEKELGDLLLECTNKMPKELINSHKFSPKRLMFAIDYNSYASVLDGFIERKAIDSNKFSSGSLVDISSNYPGFSESLFAKIITPYFSPDSPEDMFIMYSSYIPGSWIYSAGLFELKKDSSLDFKGLQLFDEDDFK